MLKNYNDLFYFKLNEFDYYRWIMILNTNIVIFVAESYQKTTW